jgi:hypothetical protein
MPFISFIYSSFNWPTVLEESAPWYQHLSFCEALRDSNCFPPNLSQKTIVLVVVILLVLMEVSFAMLVCLVISIFHPTENLIIRSRRTVLFGFIFSVLCYRYNL